MVGTGASGSRILPRPAEGAASSAAVGRQLAGRRTRSTPCRTARTSRPFGFPGLPRGDQGDENRENGSWSRRARGRAAPVRDDDRRAVLRRGSGGRRIRCDSETDERIAGTTDRRTGCARFDRRASRRRVRHGGGNARFCGGTGPSCSRGGDRGGSIGRRHGGTATRGSGVGRRLGGHAGIFAKVLARTASFRPLLETAGRAGPRRKRDLRSVWRVSAAVVCGAPGARGGGRRTRSGSDPQCRICRRGGP